MTEQHERSARRRPKLDNSELVKTGFWVGQIFMLIATVLGVYLASQQGLSQAIAFSDLDDMQKNYYLRRSLHDELADNIQVVRDYIKTVKEDKPYDLKRYHPQLQFFVWDTMKYNPNTLQTPSVYLSAVRRYYSEIEYLINRGEHRTYGRDYFLGLLAKSTDKVEESTLKTLANNTDTLKANLAKQGVSVE
ncbi:hypothetical protein [Gallaecimonas mangrovi]|uniref:hypothetical protein n=1 Tax=Gallaecimonas mangrovi TaxID=2291597 RepID=UPI000E1FF9ED|nr:hypothetical protein [Gallaecimonas mangrovi]